MQLSPIVRLAVVLSGSMLVAAAATAPAHAEDPLPGRIVGHYTTYGSGAAVAGAYVSVGDATGSGAGYTVTDATGAFEIGDLAPGDYKVSFATDTMWQWWHQQRDEATADLVTVVSEADTRLEEQTLPTGSLEVTVADSVTGQPIPGACVDAFPAGGG